MEGLGKCDHFLSVMIFMSHDLNTVVLYPTSCCQRGAVLPPEVGEEARGDPRGLDQI